MKLHNKAKHSILKFIKKNLEWGNQKQIAIQLSVRESTVSLVLTDKKSSTRILNACLDKAMDNKAKRKRLEAYLKK